MVELFLWLDLFMRDNRYFGLSRRTMVYVLQSPSPKIPIHISRGTCISHQALLEIHPLNPILELGFKVGLGQEKEAACGNARYGDSSAGQP